MSDCGEGEKGDTNGYWPSFWDAKTGNSVEVVGAQHCELLNAID